MHVKRVDHLSFTVADLERSRAFYQRFGFADVKRYISAGAVVDRGADTPDADMDILWLTRPEGGPMLELIRYLKHPAGRSAHNSKVGAAHICFVLDDVLGAHEELTRLGVTFLSEPNEDEFGIRWVYLRDPDGNAVELIQEPPADRPTDAKRSHDAAVGDSAEALIAELERQEDELQFPGFDNDDAWRLGCAVVDLARRRGLPVTVDVCRHGHQLFHVALPGTAPDNDEWIRRKVATVRRFSASSYLVGRRMRAEGRAFAAADGVEPLHYAAAGGSFPIRVRGTGVVGAVTVSGLEEAADHDLVVAVLTEHLRTVTTVGGDAR